MYVTGTRYIIMNTYTVWTLENENCQWNKYNFTFSKMVHYIFTNWEGKLYYFYGLNNIYRWPWNLVCIIGCSSTTKFVQMMTLDWPWPILRQDQIMFLYGEKGKTMYFSETIVVYDLKLATYDRSGKKFLLTSKLCPRGAVCPLHRGCIHVLNHENIV